MARESRPAAEEIEQLAALQRDDLSEPGSILLAATVRELRERADRLHAATEELQEQNARLLDLQRALAGERARYQELFHLAPDAWVLTTASGRIAEANDRASDLLRAGAEPVVGKHLAEFVHAAERRAFRTTLAELARGGGRRQRALRILPRTGSAIDVEATVASVPKADDGATLLWLLRDVSEHVGAKRRLGETITEREAELEETRTRAERERIHLRDLMQRLNEGVIAIDQDLVVVYANGSARHFFLPTRLVEGASLPEPWPKVELRKLARELFTSRPKVADIQVDDGAGRTLSIRAIPAVGTETAGLVVSDISSRQRRERAEREFVANAAHELRTPLTAILGAIEVLQRGAKDEPAERERFLAHIERECARLERLTSALLVLARAQMGVEPPRLELVEVRPLLEEVAGELRPASRVRVEVSCAPELAVFANRPLLEQALGNLTSNAAKHTHRGTIALKGMAEGDALVALEVSDTGTGMAPDVRERGVERFYRKGVEPGFGLGLAIATEAARVLGGRIEIESRPGHGTTARILLPSAYMVRSE